MLNTLTGKQFLEMLAPSLTVLLSTVLERLFGPNVHTLLFGNVSWADLGVLLCFVLHPAGGRHFAEPGHGASPMERPALSRHSILPGMKIRILPGSEQDSDRTAPVCLAAVLVYEDTACGSRARMALDRALSHLPPQEVCALDLWPFDLLDYPLLRREAAACAGRSAVIALSLHGDQPLPPGVESWLDLWLGQDDRESQALAGSGSRRFLTAGRGGAAAGRMQTQPGLKMT